MVVFDLIQSAFYRNAPCLEWFCVCVCVHGAFMNGSDSTIIELEYDINTVNEYLILRFVVLPVLIHIFFPSFTCLLDSMHSLSFFLSRIHLLFSARATNTQCSHRHLFTQYYLCTHAKDRCTTSRATMLMLLLLLPLLVIHFGDMTKRRAKSCRNISLHSAHINISKREAKRFKSKINCVIGKLALGCSPKTTIQQVRVRFRVRHTSIHCENGGLVVV